MVHLPGVRDHLLMGNIRADTKVFFFFLIVRGAEEHGMERFVVFFSFFLLVGVFSLVWYSVR